VPVKASVVRRKSASSMRGSISARTALPLTVNARGIDTEPPLRSRAAHGFSIPARREGKDTAAAERGQRIDAAQGSPVETPRRFLQIGDVLREIFDVGFRERTGDARHVAGIVGPLARLERG